MTGLSRRLIEPLLVVSGFAALVYEVVWLRELTLVLGRTTYSVSIILAAFMGGIALGNIVFGRLADRSVRPLRLFALIEFAIAASGVALLGAFEVLGPLYQSVVELTGISFNGVTAMMLKPTVAFVVLTVQTMFMGGTLPAISRHVVRRDSDIGGGVGRVYAANTAGAVLGVGTAGFVLLPQMGAIQAALCAIVANLLVGGLALFMSFAAGAQVPQAEPSGDGKSSPESRRLLLLYFVVGGTAIAYEVLWTRQLVYLLGNSAYAFSVMLLTFLLGLTGGSVLYARGFPNQAPPARLFGSVQIAIGLAALAGIELAYQLRYLRGLLRLWTGASEWLGLLVIEGSLAFVLIALPTFLFGASFPLVNALYVEKVGELGRGVAKTTAVNGLGGIVGSLAAGFVLVPLLGVNASIAGVAGINVAVGVGFGVRQLGRMRSMSFGIAAGAAVFGLGAVFFSGAPPALASGPTARRRNVLYFDEGADATVAVLESRRGNRLLDINGVVTAGDTFTDVVVHQMLAHRGGVFHPHPKRVLVIGFGLGITANSATTHPLTERVDIVELLRQERHTAPFFRHYNQDVLQHKNVRLVVGDGREYVATTAERYDVISFNAIHPRLGASLYTSDFYRACQAKLQKGGWVVGWIPTNWMTPDEFRSQLATFISVFDESVLWYVNPAHLVIVGGSGASKLDAERGLSVLQNPRVKADLALTYSDELSSFLGTFLMGPEGLRRYAAGAPINTDNRSWLEYARSRDPKIHTGVVESLLKGREPVTRYLTGADETLAARVSAVGKGLNDLAMGELYSWKYEQTRVARGRMARALETSNNDTYFRYIAAGYGAASLPGELRSPRAQPAPVLIEIGDDDDPIAFFDAGVKHLRSKSFAEAVAAFDAAVALEPDYVAAHTNLGYAHKARGEFELAAKSLKRAMWIEPRGWLPHYHLARVYLAQNETALARKSFAAAIDRNPYYRDAMTELADVLQQEGQAAQARKWRQRAHEVDPESPAP